MSILNEPVAPPRAQLVRTDKQAKGDIVTAREMLDDAARLGILRGAYDYYRDNENLIPDEWRGKVVFFPETEFSDGDRRRVRCLCVDDDDCEWHDFYVSGQVYSEYHVLAPAT